MQIVRACPTVQAPDGLLPNLAHEPNIMAVLGGCINASTWMEVIKTQFIDYVDNPAARAENPQDSKSKYGEGMLFAEAFVWHFNVSSG
jgi:hypothetical protein